MSAIRTVVLCTLAITTALLHSQPAKDPAEPPLSGTWFGSFVLATPDGKTSHDTAVLIFSQSGPQVAGSIGRTVDQQTPFKDGQVKDNSLAFHLDAAGGLDFSLRLNSGHLQGTAVGKGARAELDMQPAPGLLPHQELVEQITEADTRLFQAFDSCDVSQYASLLSQNLEFYQDHTGKTGYEENLKALRDRCAEGITLRRELDQNSLVVNAAPGYGAIEAGTHRFYSRQQDGSEHLDATAQFTEVWSKDSGSWKLVRIISYDHR